MQLHLTCATLYCPFHHFPIISNCLKSDTVFYYQPALKYMYWNFNPTNHSKLLTLQKQYLCIHRQSVSVLISLEKEKIISIRDLLIHCDYSITLQEERKFLVRNYDIQNYGNCLITCFEIIHQQSMKETRKERSNFITEFAVTLVTLSQAVHSVNGALQAGGVPCYVAWTPQTCHHWKEGRQLKHWSWF